MPAGQKELDPEFLAKAARSIASQKAQEYELFLSPEALPAIDFLVKERIPILSRKEFDFSLWQNHVRHISDEVAQHYKKRSIRRITNPDNLIRTVKAVFKVYPYD